MGERRGRSGSSGNLQVLKAIQEVGLGAPSYPSLQGKVLGYRKVGSGGFWALVKVNCVCPQPPEHSEKGSLAVVTSILSLRKIRGAEPEEAQRPPRRPLCRGES